MIWDRQTAATFSAAEALDFDLHIARQDALIKRHRARLTQSQF